MTAFTFPLSLDEFFSGLKISVASFDLAENMQISATGGGEVLGADRGPRLWTGSVEIVTQYHDQMRAVESRAKLLRQAGRSFFVYSPAARCPASDPDGAKLGAASPEIASVNVNMRELALNGLPAGYRLSPGDMLSFAYGTSPTRYALHEIVSASVVANGAGQTPQFEVVPALRPGAAAQIAVTLVQPFCKAVMVPGSFRPSTASALLSSGFAFDFTQTLR